MRAFDPERFLSAKDKVLSSAHAQNGIGTLGEKTLHRILKHYYEPLDAFHEQKVGRYVADIVNEDGIIEIQTRSFSKMRKKLDAFLSVADVTVVYPLVRHKWLGWIDPETGEMTQARKSPKTGTVYDAFWELGFISDLLLHPNLTLCIPLFDMDETKLLNGYGKAKKYRATRHDRVPRALISETVFASSDDYRALIPDTLPPQFTRAELACALGQSPDRIQPLIRVLTAVGAITQAGKRGNAYLYTKT